MTKAKTLSHSAYASLKNDVARILSQAQSRAKMILSRELAVAYWQIGKRISRDQLTETAGYQQSVITRLSEDLGINVRVLQSALLFYRTYQKPPSSEKLSWSHYRELLRLRDPDERRFYEQLAVEQSLSSKQLCASITADRYAQQTAPAAGAKTGNKARPARLQRPTDARFTYKATVQRVVDADTLELMVDLGFEVFKQQRVRLAGIDAPDIETPAGDEAYRYVIERLARAPFVMVKTNRIDIYGRYVGHVFYALKPLDSDAVFASGEYLNQQLLDRGLARPI
jgi:endonuclease YncB( thermonuclease family)